MVKTRRRKTVKNRTMKKQIKNRQLRKRRTKKRGGMLEDIGKRIMRRSREPIHSIAATNMIEVIRNIDSIVLDYKDEKRDNIDYNKKILLELKDMQPIENLDKIENGEDFLVNFLKYFFNSIEFFSLVSTFYN